MKRKKDWTAHNKKAAKKSRAKHQELKNRVIDPELPEYRRNCPVCLAAPGEPCMMPRGPVIQLNQSGHSDTIPMTSPHPIRAR